MSLHEDLDLVASAVPESIATFRERLDETWIARALQATGVATMRRRRLPAEQVIWLVLGMAIMRDLRASRHRDRQNRGIVITKIAAS